MQNNRRASAMLVILMLAFFSFQTCASASPWAKKQSYGAKTAGKLGFGLKHTLFSWLFWWTESREPQYEKEWQGFSTGIGKSVVYTAAGAVQLVTFFIPADFPDIGIGLHIPSKECPARHAPDYVPPAPKPARKAETTEPKTAEPMRLSETPEEMAAHEEEIESVPAPQPVVMEAKRAEPVLHPGELTAEETIEAKKAEMGIPQPVSSAEPAEEEDEDIPAEEELAAMDRELNAFLAANTESNNQSEQSWDDDLIPQSRS